MLFEPNPNPEYSLYAKMPSIDSETAFIPDPVIINRNITEVAKESIQMYRYDLQLITDCLSPQERRCTYCAKLITETNDPRNIIFHCDTIKLPQE
jgi:hypothetical protein